MNKLVEIQVKEDMDEKSEEFYRILRDIILYCSPELSEVLEKENLKKLELRECHILHKHKKVHH